MARGLLRVVLVCAAAGVVVGFSGARLGQRPRARRRAAAGAAEEDEEGAGLMVTIAEVPRPLGLILEEQDGGGVAVIDIDPRGNAARSDILVGDRLLMVDDEACGEADFDAVAGLIASSARERVELTLGRRIDTVRVAWPNGRQTGALPGEALRDVAARANYPVRYSCAGGSCGVCEHRLRTPGDTRTRYTRICRARVPAGADSAEVLPGDRF